MILIENNVKQDCDKIKRFTYHTYKDIHAQYILSSYQDIGLEFTSTVTIKNSLPWFTIKIIFLRITHNSIL
jgi:hypothetical protein